MALHRPHLRLRARIILTFTLGGALLSILLAVTTYGLTRENLLNQREQTSVGQAGVNANTVQNGLIGLDTTSGEAVVDLLESLPRVGDASVLLNLDGGWQAPGALGESDLPESLIRLTLVDDQPGRIRYVNAGVPSLAVGIPLNRVDGAYFELTPLGELESSLRSLAAILIVAGGVTTIAGATLGVWASRRVLRPLGDVGAAAEAIAGGRLDTRLEESVDPDLTPLASSFNRMAAALQDRIDRDARFASDVSHELRSPLMTLRASIDVLMGRRDELTDRGQAALDLLDKDVDRFERLIADLLEISRIDAGAADMSVDELRPSELVRQVLAGRQRCDTTLDVAPGTEEILVEADKRRLAQVLTNLLDNADHYAGGATRVGVEADGSGWVRIVVDDAGPGIPPDEVGRVFERFARGSTSGNRGLGGGTGLGLALVREHVRLHGGRVWVEPLPDGSTGSRFVIELPEVAA